MASWADAPVTAAQPALPVGFFDNAAADAKARHTTVEEDKKAQFAYELACVCVCVCVCRFSTRTLRVLCGVGLVRVLCKLARVCAWCLCLRLRW